MKERFKAVKVSICSTEGRVVDYGIFELFEDAEKAVRDASGIKTPLLTDYGIHHLKDDESIYFILEVE